MIDLTCPVQQGARRHPENIALIASDAEITYLQLDTMIERRILALKANGISAGSRVGVHAVTNVDTIVSLFALARIGAMTCLLNVRWPEQELDAVVRRLSIAAIVAGEACRVSPTSAVADGSRNADLRQDVIPRGCDYSERGVVLFTSGTSTFPKAALLSIENLIYNAAGANERIPLVEQSRWLLSLPLYHVGGVGILYRSFLAGGAVILPSQTVSLAMSIQRHAPTHLSVVHTQLWRLLRDESLTHRKWPTCLLGGGPTTQELIRFAVSRNIPLHLSYGLTEMGSQVTTSELITSPDFPMSTGPALTYRMVQVAPSSEILVAGETLLKGYITPDGIDACRNSDGWFHTGDMGEWSDNGSLVILGRKDNQFISGGENVHPESIESVLMSVPGIELAIVVPQDDPEFGHRPVAFAAEEGCAILRHETVSRATRILSETLSRYMHPIAWYQLPGEWQSTGIKPRRRELKELLRTPEKLIRPVR